MRAEDTHSSSPPRQRLWDVAPAAVAAVIGAVWIAGHAATGRGQTHTIFQILALTETTIALLLRRRKPLGALTGILVVYLLVDLAAILLLPLAIALATVMLTRNRRATAIAAAVTLGAVAAMPLLHGDRSSTVVQLTPAAVVTATAILGYLGRTLRPGYRQPGRPRPHFEPGQADPTWVEAAPGPGRPGCAWRSRR